MIRPHKLGEHFSRDLILVFIVITVSVIGAITYFSIKAKQNISQQYINDTANNSANAFHEMLKIMNQKIELVHDLGATGEAPFTDKNNMNRVLFPMLRQDKMLHGISIADTEGESYYLTVAGEGWRTSRTGKTKENRQTVNYFWNADQNLMSEEKYATEYDARQRPWFFSALAGEGVYWTQPYRFYSLNKVGITGSLAFVNNMTKKKFVIAFDILLDDLFSEIHKMGPSEKSKVFIFKRDAQLYVSESKDSFPDFHSVNEVEDQLTQKMLTFWTREQLPANEGFSLKHNNETWWCGFRPLDRVNRNIWIGVMVPESDITANITLHRSKLWLVGVLLVVLAGGLVFWFNRRYSHILSESENSFDGRHPKESVRFLIDKGEGRTVEFKSTMRMNLHTQKMGKEIEIAWLKTVVAFMNTDGGTILLGVTDEGNISGLEQDDFANEDKCRLHFKNLVNQHIGPEFSKYLRFVVLTMESKQIGVVACGRASEPAYLKSGKKEAFYIRNGPSSEELPVSKVVAYIQNRH